MYSETPTYVIVDKNVNIFSLVTSNNLQTMLMEELSGSVKVCSNVNAKLFYSSKLCKPIPIGYIGNMIVFTSTGVQSHIDCCSHSSTRGLDDWNLTTIYTSW